MTTSELIKRLRTKMAAMERSELTLDDYDQRVLIEIHDLLFDLEEGKRFNDQYVAILATFLLNGLLPSAVNDDDRKERADMILRKAWKSHVERFLTGVGIDMHRLDEALPKPDLVVISSTPGLGKVSA